MGYKGTTIQSDAADLTHLQFFTKKSLEKLAGESQFKITRFGKTNFFGECFSLFTAGQPDPFFAGLDCRVAELLPTSFTGGFVTVWEKNSR